MSNTIHPGWYLPAAVHAERHAAKRRLAALPQGRPTAFPPTSERAVAKCVRSGLARGWSVERIAAMYAIDPARVRAVLGETEGARAVASRRQRDAASRVQP